MKKELLTLSMGALLMASCGGAQQSNKQETNANESAEVVAQSNSVAFEALAGKWNIVKFGANEVARDSASFIAFDIDSMRMSASAGCNGIGGEISRTGSNADFIAFENVLATQMMCENMQNEAMLLDAVNKTRAFRPEGEKINLVDEKDSVLVVLQK